MTSVGFPAAPSASGRIVLVSSSVIRLLRVVRHKLSALRMKSVPAMVSWCSLSELALASLKVIVLRNNVGGKHSYRVAPNSSLSGRSTPFRRFCVWCCSPPHIDSIRALRYRPLNIASSVICSEASLVLLELLGVVIHKLSVEAIQSVSAMAHWPMPLRQTPTVSPPSSTMNV